MLRSYQLSDQLSIEALHSIMERRGTIHLENSTGQSRTPGHANTRAVLTLTTLTSAPLSIKSAAMSPGFEQKQPRVSSVGGPSRISSKPKLFSVAMCNGELPHTCRDLRSNFDNQAPHQVTPAA